MTIQVTGRESNAFGTSLPFRKKGFGRPNEKKLDALESWIILGPSRKGAGFNPDTFYEKPLTADLPAANHNGSDSSPLLGKRAIGFAILV